MIFKDSSLFFDEVHLWHISFEQYKKRLSQFWSLLSSDEKGRAKELLFDEDQERFILSRGVLRELLSEYTGIDARLLEFSYNSSGKPMLKGAENSIYFNLSQSNEMALYAFSRGRRVGIDIEPISEDFDFSRVLLHRIFQKERTLIQLMPCAIQRKAFFNFWSMQEAYCKATGVRVIQLLEESNRCSSSWTLLSLLPDSDYSAVLVVEGSSFKLCYRQPSF